MRIAVLVPALNESENIAALVASVPAPVVVIDNGSTDDTAAKALAAGARVVHEPRRGYGRAVQAGIRALASDPPDVVVILDADRADDPALLGRLVQPIADDRADLVVADRTRTAMPGALTPPQRFGNQLTVWLIGLVSGRRFRDLGAFRAIRWSSLQALGLVDPTGGWNVEMNLKAVKIGLRVLEVPLPYAPRRAGKSKVSGSIVGGARAGYRMLQAVHRYR